MTHIFQIHDSAYPSQPTPCLARQRVPRSQAQRRISVLRRCSPGAFVVYVKLNSAMASMQPEECVTSVPSLAHLATSNRLAVTDKGD